MLDRDTARADIRRQWRELLPRMGIDQAPRRVHGEPSYICPLCANGSGTDGDGMTFIPGTDALKCFKCGFAGDVLDLYQQMNGVDHAQAIDDLAGMLGMPIESLDEWTAQKKAERDGYSYTQRSAGTPSLQATETAQNAAQAVKKETAAQGAAAENVDSGAAEAAERAAFIKKAQYRLSDPAAQAYLKQRGISFETAQKFRCGYEPAWTSPTAKKRLAEQGKTWRPAPTPRLIMPIDGDAGYTARDTRQRIPDAESKYKKMVEGGSGLTGADKLDLQQPVFVTEGVFDALSIMEAGGQAVALNSTSNARRLLEYFKDNQPVEVLLALDTDQAGRKCSRDLADSLNKLGIPCQTVSLCGDFKDPNDALVSNRDFFLKQVQKALAGSGPRPDSVLSYMDTGGLDADIAAFGMNIRPTGFPYLDELTGGGLHTGLYMLAAIPSLGKTTFCWQIADYLAVSGTDVLYFALEQSKAELAVKSLARRAALRDEAEGSAIEAQRISSTAIRAGYWSNARKAAQEQFRVEAGDRLSVIEAGAEADAAYIANYTRRYIRRTGTTPVVMIDYIQLLKPPDGAKDVRIGLIETGRTLRTLVRELNLTMVCISSVNRQNYTTEFSFETLKESGSLEFDSDFVAGLQLEAIHDSTITDEKKSATHKRKLLNKEKKKNPRHVELSIVKNRFGPASFSDHLLYYPAVDLFREDDQANDDAKREAAEEAAADEERRPVKAVKKKA